MSFSSSFANSSRYFQVFEPEDDAKRELRETTAKLTSGDADPFGELDLLPSVLVEERLEDPSERFRG